MIYEKENNGFAKLIDFVLEHWYAHTVYDLIFRFVYDDKVIEAKYDTMFETDNGEELDSPEYDEYNAMAFENLETHELFEVNYKNLPKELYCNGKRII